MGRFFRSIGILDVLFLLAGITTCSIQMAKFANDPGVGWHLKAGELVLQGQFPYYDSFLSGPARRWISDQWLSDALLSLSYGVGSWPLVYALLAGMFLLTMLVVLFLGISRFTGLTVLSGLSVILALKLAQVHFILRPTLISFLFFTGVFLPLVFYYSRIKAGDGSRNLGGIAYLPLLFIVWANVHPSFVLGLLALFLLPVSLLVEQMLYKTHFERSLYLELIGLFLLCTAGTLLNPNGIELHKSILWLSQSDFFMTLHMEWKSPDFREFEGMLFEAVVGIVFVSLALVHDGRLRKNIFPLLLFLVFAHLSLKAVRILPFFGIVSTIPFVLALADLKKLPLFSIPRLIDDLDWLEARERRTYCGLVSVGLVIALLFSGALFQNRMIFLNAPLGPSRTEFPYAALDALKAKHADGGSAVVATSPDWGGFVAWYGGGKLKPIIDDRNTLVGETFYKEFVANMKPSADYYKFLRAQDASYLLVRPDGPLGAAVSSKNEFPVVYRDSVAILFDVRPKLTGGSYNLNELARGLPKKGS